MSAPLIERKTTIAITEKPYEKKAAPTDVAIAQDRLYHTNNSLNRPRKNQPRSLSTKSPRRRNPSRNASREAAYDSRT